MQCSAGVLLAGPPPSPLYRTAQRPRPKGQGGTGGTALPGVPSPTSVGRRWVLAAGAQVLSPANRADQSSRTIQPVLNRPGCDGRRASADVFFLSGFHPPSESLPVELVVVVGIVPRWRLRRRSRMLS